MLTKGESSPGSCELIVVKQRAQSRTPLCNARCNNGEQWGNVANIRRTIIKIDIISSPCAERCIVVAIHARSEKNTFRVSLVDSKAIDRTHLCNVLNVLAIYMTSEICRLFWYFFGELVVLELCESLTSLFSWNSYRCCDLYGSWSFSQYFLSWNVLNFSFYSMVFF